MKLLIIIATAAVVAVLVLSMKRKISGGSSCCGEHEAPVEHIRVRDTDPRNYPYHYLLKVEGMVCANCAKRVENAFNATGTFLAKVDLGRKEVRLNAKQALNRREAAQIVDAAGYTLTDFNEAVI